MILLVTYLDQVIVNSLTVCSYHLTYAFQSESTFYSFLNVIELLAQNRLKIWSLSDSNGTRTHNRWVRKRTFNHLAKLVLSGWNKWLRAKWLWVRVPLQSLLIVFIILETLCSIQNNKGNTMQHDGTTRPYIKVILITPTNVWI